MSKLNNLKQALTLSAAYSPLNGFLGPLPQGKASPVALEPVKPAPLKATAPGRAI